MLREPGKPEIGRTRYGTGTELEADQPLSVPDWVFLVPNIWGETPHI